MVNLLIAELSILVVSVFILGFILINNKKKFNKSMNERLRVLFEVSKSFYKQKNLKDISKKALSTIVDMTPGVLFGGIVFCDPVNRNFSCIYDSIKGHSSIEVSDNFVKRIENTRHYFNISKEDVKLNNYLSYSKSYSDYSYLHVIKFYLQKNTFGAFFFGTKKNKFNYGDYDYLRIIIDHFAFGLQSINLSSRLSHFSKTIEVLENVYQNIVDNLPVGLIGIDNSNDNVVLWNDNASKLFQLDENNILGKNFLQIFSKKKNMDNVKKIVKNTSFYMKDHEIKYIKFENEEGNTRYLNILSYPLKSKLSDFDGTVLMIRDVSENIILQKELEEAYKLREKELQKKVNSATKELRDANIELRRMNNLKSEFVSVVSHELRTPLTSIRGYASLLLSERLGDINDKQKESISVIDNESKRLSNLINDILDLSRLESGRSTLNLQDEDIVNTVKGAIDSLMIQIKNKNISLEREGRKSLFIAHDKDKIYQVIYNLVGNAIKFTPNNGKIFVKINSGKNYCTIRIKDTGIGISKKDQKNIFQPFLQAEGHMKRNIKGSGLGLTISKHIIELHHGNITLNSKLNKGSEFVLKIPNDLNSKK
ncbi:MAG: ATP-binding protein [Nanobdellota archaeon]